VRLKIHLHDAENKRSVWYERSHTKKKLRKHLLDLLFLTEVECRLDYDPYSKEKKKHGVSIIEKQAGSSY